MTPDERNGLIAAFLDGTLDERGCAELQELLRADPDLLEELAAQHEADAALRALGRSAAARNRLTERIVGAVADEARNHRIEELVKREVARISDRRQAVRRLLTRFALPAAAAALLAVGLWLAARGTVSVQAVVAALDGPPPTVRTANGSRPEPAREGMRLHRGDRIEAAPGTTVRLSCPSEATVLELSDGAVCRFGGGGRGKQLELLDGRLAAKVDRQPDGAPLTILTPHAEMTVKGTQLTVSVAGDATRLEVTSGLVGMRSLAGGEAHDVGAGRWALAREGHPGLSAPGRQLRRVFAKPFDSPMAARGGAVAVTRAGTVLWLLSGDGEALFRIDDLDRVRDAAGVELDAKLSTSADIAWDGELLWGLDGENRNLLRAVDPAGGRTVRTLQLPESRGIARGPYVRSCALEFAERSLWVGRDHQICRIDPADGRVLARLEVALPKGYQPLVTLAFTRGGLYAVQGQEDTVLRIDPNDGRVVARFGTERHMVNPRLTSTDGQDLWVLEAVSSILWLVEGEQFGEE